jgi:hypothetical protein
MRVLVCGGRDYRDAAALDGFLKFWHLRLQFTEVIHGAARGADRLAGAWAQRNRIPVRPFPADWDRYGMRAGPVRNQQMLDQKPDLVIAFPGGRGTADMVRRARAAGLEVIEAW